MSDVASPQRLPSDDSGLWRRAREIFEEALTADRGAWPDLLARRCAGDDRLKEAVRTLLYHDVAAEGFLAQPVVDPRSHRWLGARLGRYRLLEILGQGGSGVVFLAAREAGDFDQRAAVKILRHSLDEEQLKRFAQERQILAQLNHPNIARLLDGGRTDDGYPYVVMEYVDGEAITGYCDRRRLSVDERLHLFQRVCAAVAHAHRHLVIHRDLKPSNILVAEPDQVKLLDFGIAKRLQETLPQARVSRTTGRWMSPAYASPEQILGAPISIASDVFSLGVLLFELLTGRLPHHHEAALPASFPPQTQPPSSTVVGTSSEIDADEAKAIAARRRGTPIQLRRRLKNDLDHIVLRALRDEPHNRYSGADELAREIERHLKGRPVEARRGNNAYRLGKLLRRHPWAIGSAAGLSIATLAFAAFAFHQSLRLAEERDLAQRERTAVETVADALVDVVKQRQPLGGEALNAATKKTLDRTTAQLEHRFADQPLLHARLLTALGTVYHDLAFNDDADRVLLRSLDKHRDLVGPQHPSTASVLAYLADLRLDQGHLQEAEALARQALAVRRSVAPRGDASLVLSLSQLGRILSNRGEYDRARESFEEAVALGERLGEVTPLARAGYFNGLAIVLKRQGELDRARELFMEALAIHRRESGPQALSLAPPLNNLASLAVTEGDFASAERYFRESLAITRHHRGDDHPHVEVIIANLASVLNMAGNYAAAEPLYRDALERARQRYGTEHVSVGTRLSNLGILLRELDRIDEAWELLQRALAQRRQLLGQHSDTASTLSNLGLVALDRGEPEQAEAYLREALEMQQRILGADHWLAGNSLIILAKIALSADRPCEASPLARSALDIFIAALPNGHWRQADAENVLGAALGRLGDRERAGELLRGSIPVLERAKGKHTRNARDARARLQDFVENPSSRPRSCPPATPDSS